MLRDADTAMYSAKASGGGSIIFDQAMHLQALERLHLESELRQALEQQEFVLYYQPIVSLPGGKIEGFESLLRWRSPYRGFIPPGDFIPLAEETGLIVPLGGWVLHEACCQVQRWRERFGQEPFLQVNVNISARQFLQPDMASVVARSLNDACLEGSCLCLELTEGVAMDDAERTSRMLEELRRLGVRLSIDDFGTGYSSLNYLHRFPVETLKIDRSFVGNMDQDERNQNIVRAIISLAHNLRMKVVAEGDAESLQQLLELLKKGPGGAYVREVVPTWLPATGEYWDFRVKH
jgi:EAL domain-containing protein (putative c-di-GMP-specific phosphodiesterase class I)